MTGRILCLVFLFLLAAGCASQGAVKSDRSPVESSHSAIEEKWGIKIVAVRLTEAGFMVDLRYKVTDPERAKPIMRLSAQAYIIDQKSGVKVNVPFMPKVGSLRSSSRQPIAGKQYFVLFGNNLKFIRPGDKITVVIGDLRVEDLVVE